MKRNQGPAAVFDSGSSLHDKRAQLRLLDACLSTLEEAHERDESRMSNGIATRLARYVPNLRPGMLIVDAIDRVLQEQEKYLNTGDDDDMREAGTDAARGASGQPREASQGQATPEAPRPLDEVEARELTNRIRTAANDVCLLILEAHRRNAASVLGYETWERYVRQEFEMSRRRSYELLDQAQVRLAIRDAVPMCGIPHIRPFVAGYIKPHMDDVIGEVRARLAEAPHVSPELVVNRVIDEERKRFAAERRRQRFKSRPARSRPAGRDIGRFWHAIAFLASLPPVSDVAPYLDHGSSKREAQLERASSWLAMLLDSVEKRVA